MSNHHLPARRLALATATVALIAAGAFAAYLGYQQLRGNFHEVVAGQLYRSGQLTADQIAYYTRRYGIRTIINLRGSSEKSLWYRDEVAASKALGLVHVNFAMSANRELPLDRATQLEAILRDVPKPVLIHCRSGSDRSGLASAIFMHTVRGEDIEKAEGQISLYFGHFSIPYLSQAYPMDQTWEKLEDVYRAREREARI
jgi:protein tyrosine/serine phosphatase